MSKTKRQKRIERHAQQLRADGRNHYIHASEVGRQILEERQLFRRACGPPKVTERGDYTKPQIITNINL